MNLFDETFVGGLLYAFFWVMGLALLVMLVVMALMLTVLAAVAVFRLTNWLLGLVWEECPR